MSQLSRIAGSFAIVVVVYWAYSLLAVPWIEPQIDLRGQEEITKADRQRAEDLVNVQRRQLQGLFRAGAWELNEPKVLDLDNQRAKLLFQDYENLPDGRVKIHPLTMVFAYEGPADSEEQRQRQSVVLEVPNGAVLQFDRPLDVSQASVGRLIAGQLNGTITIRSGGREPGPEDDLWIATKNVKMSEQTVTTNELVEFRWGPHFGHGHDMLIKLIAGRARPGAEGTGPNISGIESFELRHVEQLHLDLGQMPSSSTMPNETPASVPVEVNCRGPFRFDVVHRVATFRDYVDVVRRNATGAADQLACDLLSIYCISRDKKTKPAANAAGSLDLVAERIEARGKPVVVTAPSERLVSRAERFDYNILANAIALDGGHEVFLQQGPNEIHAPTLRYQSAGEGRLGQLAAQGPGWLRGQSPDRSDQQIEAVWQGQLKLLPEGKEHVVSLTGGAELKFHDAGQLQAKDIFLWLVELPPTVGSQALNCHPTRMAARNDVHLNAKNLSSHVEDLEVWFREGPATVSRSANPISPVSIAAQPPVGAPPSGPQPNPATPTALERFQVDGRRLRAQLLLGEDQAAISDLTIDDGVQLTETQSAQPTNLPVRIRGDHLKASDLTAPNASVVVVGQPARFEGRGLGLSGAEIHVRADENRLSIDGPGQMDLAIPNDLQGRKLAAPGVLTIDWRGGMSFDGRTAEFNESVVAAAPRLQSQTEMMQSQLQTETMRVRLLRPIRFTQPSMAEPPALEEIQCHGGVSMENRSFDFQQQLTSHDRMVVSDLVVNLANGELNGGAGWINSVRREAPATTPGVIPSRPANQLTGLNVRFQRSITGNILRREIHFQDQVQMAYAPVDNWDAMLMTTDPDKLGPDGATIRCDQLSVAEMLLPMGNQRSIELYALNNAVVEGTTFTARGHRITYSQAKDLLVLESDGITDAELFRQTQVGAPRQQVTAKKIYYWRKSNQFSVEGAQSLQIDQTPGDSRK